MPRKRDSLADVLRLVFNGPRCRVSAELVPDRLRPAMDQALRAGVLMVDGGELRFTDRGMAAYIGLDRAVNDLLSGNPCGK